MNKKVIGVTFDVGTPYTLAGMSPRMRERMMEHREKVYYYNTVLKHKVGDIVVINCRSGLRLVTVAELDVVLATAAAAWVVQKVTLGTHNTRMRKVERAEELRTRLKEKLDVWKDDEAYRVMASTDAEAKRLYKELKDLGL